MRSVLRPIIFQRRLAIASLAAAAFAISGCTTITSHSGYQTIDTNPADLAVGTDTKSTVRAKLGSPSVTSTFDPNVWFCVSQVKARAAFRRPQVIKRDIVAPWPRASTRSSSSARPAPTASGRVSTSSCRHVVDHLSPRGRRARTRSAHQAPAVRSRIPRAGRRKPWHCGAAVKTRRSRAGFTFRKVAMVYGGGSGAARGRCEIRVGVLGWR